MWGLNGNRAAVIPAEAGIQSRNPWIPANDPVRRHDGAGYAGMTITGTITIASTITITSTITIASTSTITITSTIRIRRIGKIRGGGGASLRAVYCMNRISRTKGLAMSVTLARSPFTEIPQAPPDPIIGVTEAFNRDTNPKKVNLGVGVYQDGSGKVPVLRAVRKAEERWLSEENSKSYLPIDGVPAYNRAVQELLFGPESRVIGEGQACTVQGLGGTGALRVGADFLKRFSGASTVWISSPSWENHRALFEAAGFEVKSYPYYDVNSHGVDFDGMARGLADAPRNSIVVLHACCHNPTGVDLNPAQWGSVIDLVQSRELIPYIDFAYQGFGDGIDEDAFAVRAFADARVPCVISSSFSKSLSLYRERVGALTVLTQDADESKRVLSQLKRVIRTNYSSPSSHGGQVAAIVLGDPSLRALWEEELTEMRERIKRMRSLFVRTLREKGVRLDFSFIERQNGMFSYSGLSADHARKLRDEHSVYIVESGRICVAALNEGNVGYVCDSIAGVLADGVH